MTVCLLLELELKKKEKSRNENMTTSSNKEVQQINAHFFQANSLRLTLMLLLKFKS